MHIYSALRGAVFAAFLVVLVFFLKIICPLDIGCLADPFLVILFSPVYLFKVTGISQFITVGEEAFLIVCFWTIVGFVGGYLIGPFFAQKKSQLKANS
jgi:hypothetical protein